MEINSINNTPFGQILISPKTILTMKMEYNELIPLERPIKSTLIRNWNRCLNTKKCDLLITDNKKVFLLDKTGETVSEEKLSKMFIWNIDSALKRILLLENSKPKVHKRVTRYA